MLQIHCDELIAALTKRAEHIYDRLTAQMLAVHLDELRKVNEQYMMISERSLVVPTNTAQLMQLISKSLTNVTAWFQENTMLFNQINLIFSFHLFDRLTYRK